MRPLILLMMVLLAQVAACDTAADDDVRRNAPMGYTIEVRVPSRNGFETRVGGQFTDLAWNSLWVDLQITEQQWEDWQSVQQDLPLSPDFPQVSKLAYIDEGVVHFSPNDLNAECVRLIPILTSDAARQLVKGLLEASEAATREEGAEVIVHPFPA